MIGALVRRGLVAALLVSAPAAAHAPGTAWIMAAEDTAWCCTRGDDCKPIAEREIHEDAPGVWRVLETGQVFRENTRGTYLSHDLSPWACRVPGERTVRCLFIAGKGT